MEPAAIELLLTQPARVGRWCGFTLLRDDLHGGWLREMLLRREDTTLLAHRGSCKTTCLTVAIAILLLTEPDKNILFLRKTDDDVTEVLRQVQGILQHEAMRYLTEKAFGAPVELVRATAADLVCSRYRSPRGAEQLHGQGIGGSLTGKHADYIFTDDIVNLSDRLSAQERQHTRAIYSELQNIRNPGGRIFNTGTPWHREDAISLMPNPIRYDCYHTGLLDEGQLEQLRQSMPPSLFAANYELRHIAAEEALFTSCPPFAEEERLLWDGMAHIDAAYGGEDSTALTCGKMTEEGPVLYGRLWHRHAGDVLEEILSECERLRCAPVWCETNGDKGWLARELRGRGMPAHPYHEGMNKYLKIASYLKKQWPRLRFLRGTDPDYIAQIMDYTPQAQHDDAPDSAASLLRGMRG